MKYLQTVVQELVEEICSTHTPHEGGTS